MNEMARRRRWPLGLIGLIALVALVERYVAHHELDFVPYEQWDGRQSLHAATTEARACAWPWSSKAPTRSILRVAVIYQF